MYIVHVRFFPPFLIENIKTKHRTPIACRLSNGLTMNSANRINRHILYTGFQFKLSKMNLNQVLLLFFFQKKNQSLWLLAMIMLRMLTNKHTLTHTCAHKTHADAFEMREFSSDGRFSCLIYIKNQVISTSLSHRS